MSSLGFNAPARVAALAAEATRSGARPGREASALADIFDMLVPHPPRVPIPAPIPLPIPQPVPIIVPSMWGLLAILLGSGHPSGGSMSVGD